MSDSACVADTRTLRKQVNRNPIQSENRARPPQAQDQDS